MYLSKETFATVIENAPLVSIDLVVKNSEEQYLLGLRNNRPAKNFWFVPGGRILKNEAIGAAFTRLCQQELGINLTKSEAKFLGPFEHFYNDCVFSDEVSTHYVVLAYEIQVNIELSALPNTQHNRFKWFTKVKLMQRDDVHLHSKWYFD